MNGLLFRRGSEGPLHTPPMLTQPLYQSGVAQPQNLTPPDDSMGLSPVRDHHATPPVAGLLLISSPYTVVWGVPFIVILSLYRMLGCRWVSHVLIEVFERAYPPFTYGDPHSTVPAITAYVRVKAPIFHVLPGSVHLGAGLAMSAPVPTHPAPARPRPTPGEISSHDCGVVSAFAFTEPQAPVLIGTGLEKHSQLTEPLTCKIYKCWHIDTLREALLRMKYVWQSASEGRLSAINLATQGA
jgi:hypothetical protein